MGLKIQGKTIHMFMINMIMFVHVQKNNMTIWRKMGGHTLWIFFEIEAPFFSLFAVNVYMFFWAITRDFGIWNDDNKSVAE